jgi:hypothetical protein
MSIDRKKVKPITNNNENPYQGPTGTGVNQYGNIQRNCITVCESILRRKDGDFG